MRRSLIGTALLPLAGAALAPASAEVLDSAEMGFTVKTTVEVSAPPAAVWEALTRRVGEWWDSAHTWSGSASNLSLDPKPGGCFCEKLPSGGGVQHMTVLYADPPRLLRMRGALGPIQASAVDGSMTWELTAKGDATDVTMTYAVSGYRPGGLKDLAPRVDGVLSGQVRRLERRIETGSPEEKK